MANHPPDNRSYSVDEMMERLKEGEREKRRSEESELVTRPDGSQVVRVRRRKRRSKQPHKAKQARQKRLGIMALIGALFLFVAVGAAVVILLARFNSKGFRDDLKGRLLSATGAEVAITDLAVTPLKAQAKSVELEWPTGMGPKRLKLNQVSADLKFSSFIGSDWKGQEILANSGTLILGPVDSTAPVVEGAESPLSYEAYRCSKTLLSYEVAGEPIFELKNSELTMRPLETGGVQYLVRSGRVQFADWDELKVDSGLAEMVDGGFNLISLRLHPMLEPAELDRIAERNKPELFLKSIEPHRREGSARFSLAAKQFPLVQIVGEKGLGLLLQGKIAGKDGEISIDPHQIEKSTLTLPFEGTEGTLERFDFFSSLSHLLGKNYYHNPDDGEVSGVIKRDHLSMRIDDFHFESETQLHIQGNLETLANGKLRGRLKVGVPEELMMKNGSPRFAAFSNPQQGYCWIEISLSGTVLNPLDDFHTVLTAQSGSRVLETAFERLTEE